MSTNYLVNLIDQYIRYADTLASHAELMFAHDELHEECFRRLHEPGSMVTTEQSLFYHCAASYCAHVLHRTSGYSPRPPKDPKDTDKE